MASVASAPDGLPDASRSVGGTSGPLANPLDGFFTPRSVVVVGASDVPTRWGTQAVRNLEAGGYTGEIYLIHPTKKTLLGRRCHTAIKDLPVPPDLCILAVRAELVPEYVRACVERGVPAVIIIGTGFSESGTAEGHRLQDRLTEIIAGSSTRLIGPNSPGTASYTAKCVSTASTNVPTTMPDGRLALVSQGGTARMLMLEAARRYGAGVDLVASVGNEADVGLPELVRHFASRGPSAILCYIETLRDPDAFISAASEARSRGIPVLVVKGGTGQRGKMMAAAHTAALAGSTEVFDDLVEPTGAVRATSVESLVLTSVLFERLGTAPGRRLGVFGLGGSGSVLLADAIEAAGLELADIDADRRAALRKMLPDSNASNPFDSGGQFLGRPDARARLIEALETFATADSVDVLVYGMLPLVPARERVFIDAMAEVARLVDKPCVCLAAHIAQSEYRKALFTDANVLEISCNPAGLEALSLWQLWSRQSERREPDHAAAAPPGGRMLAEHEVFSLLRDRAIEVPRWQVVEHVNDVPAAAAAVGFPVVVKAIADGLYHRASVGAVAIGIHDEPAAQAAARRVWQNAAGAVGEAEVRLIVAHQVPTGLELIVGVHRDPVFGLVLMIGMGGALSESLRDVVFSSMKTFDSGHLIGRLRNREPIRAALRRASDGEARLEALLHAVVGLADEIGDDLVSIDLNPVIVNDDGVVAVDGLVVLETHEISGVENA
jgi:acyl-CoA synthetase (NDP forming)